MYFLEIKMNNKFKYLPYLCLILGFCIAVIGHSNPIKNQYVLILGIIVMLFGIYKLSVSIPSKHSEATKEEDEV